jgi:hypothetical protein
MSDTAPKSSTGNRASIIGFIAICYGIIGLVGLFATFAIPVPLERAIAREQTLDEALVALRGPTPQISIDALRDRLDDSAAAFTPLPANPDAAIAAERRAMRARMQDDSAAIGERMRWMIGVITLLAGGFGIAMTGGGRRS